MHLGSVNLYLIGLFIWLHAQGQGVAKKLRKAFDSMSKHSLPNHPLVSWLKDVHDSPFYH